MHWQYSTGLFFFSEMGPAKASMSLREICVSTNRYLTVYFQPIISVNSFVHWRIFAECDVRILSLEWSSEVNL
jgi:hypothetical protein